MKACKINTYLMGSKGIFNRISSLLLLLTCALALAACGGGGDDDGSGNPTVPTDTANVGLISQCSSDPTSSTPAGSYNVNNPLPIKEYSTTTCNFRLPRNAAIINATSSNLTLRISVGGEESVFPANNSITLTNGSDATATAIPLEGVGGALITNINLTLAPMDDEFGEVLLNFTTFHRQNNTVLGTLMYRIKVVEVPELLVFNQTSYDFGSFPTPAVVGTNLGTVSATNLINPGNSNQINYTFATGTPADTTDTLAIDIRTGNITLQQNITDAANYTFMVTASQQGAMDSNSGPVSIEFLSQNASNTLGSISQCSSNPTSSTPPGSYNINNALPIDEDSTTTCEFQLPSNAAINSTTPSNLTVNITVGGQDGASIFPASSIALTDGSDATVAPNPLADADGMFITNINLTLTPMADAFGDAMLIFTTYNNLTNTVLGTLSYPINVMPVDDAPNFPDAAYSFATIADGLKGKVLGRVEATIPADNPNQADPNYAFAADNGAADDNFTIDASTGDIALKRSLVPEDAGNYVFNVIAEQAGTAGEGSAEVTIRILNITGDEDGDGFTNAYDAAPNNAAVNVSGTGTPDDPYIISNIYQLQAIDGVDHTQKHLSDELSATGGNWLYSPNRTAQLASSYQLSNDIDAAVTRGWNKGDGTAAGFYPIGDCAGTPCDSTTNSDPFTGSLNGAGYAVHNLFINRTENGRVKGAIGLFASAIDAQIMNFGLENVNITVTIPDDTEGTSVEIGGLIGVMGAVGGIGTLATNNLNHVYVTGVIQVMDESNYENYPSYAGGLIGMIKRAINITNSYTIVNIIEGIHQGGLIGENFAKDVIIINSYSLNRIKVIEVRQAGTTRGGMVGNNLEGISITSSYTVSNVKNSDTVLSLVPFSDRDIIGNASYWFNETDGNIIVPAAGYKDAKGLSAAQLQNCGLDGFPFDGTADEVCEGLFPSGTATDPLWRDRIEDGVTTYWDFAHANEYPYLTTTPDANDNTLLPTVAEQRCQHNRFFYDLPCTIGPADM